VTRLVSRAVTALGGAVLLLAAPGPGASATTGHDVHRVADAADPGFLVHRGRYHLYSTSRGFPAWSSDSPDGGFVDEGRTMMREHFPAWWGERSDGTGAHMWAPHVFKIPRQADGSRFAMYFAASRAGTASHCIGIATSGDPVDDFVSRPGEEPFLCGPSGTTAIDPAVYRAPRGARYLVYKLRRFEPARYQIRAIRLTSTGLDLRPGARSFPVVTDRRRIVEAPSLVNHGGRVWLFVSRRKFDSCTYFTEVWSAPRVRGDFVRRGPDDGRLDIRTPSGARFCGPGGAEVVNDRGTHRIAFHAWKKRDVTSPDRVRVAWTGRLLWRRTTGVPYLAPR
jgi:hypothetical protein